MSLCLCAGSLALLLCRKGVIVEVAESHFIVATTDEQLKGLRVSSNIDRRSKRGSLDSTLTSDNSLPSKASFTGVRHHKVDLPSVGTSAEQLLSIASSNLRCIDGDQITLELMSSNTGGDIKLSRPVGPSEKIDFFMSHSWHDDAVAKVNCIRALCERFQQKYHRQPTFWLDKVTAI